MTVKTAAAAVLAIAFFAACVFVPFGMMLDYSYYDSADTRFTSWQLPVVFGLQGVMLALIVACYFKKYFKLLAVFLVLEWTLALKAPDWFSDFRQISDMDTCQDIGYCREGLLY